MVAFCLSFSLGIAFAESAVPAIPTTTSTSDKPPAAFNPDPGLLPVPQEFGAEACRTSRDLGTKINCGTISLSDLPLLIVYWIDYLTWIAGSLAVIFIMVGGVQYMVGSLSDTKDAGRDTLTYAVIGLIVTFVSWLAINMLQSFLTS